MHKPIKYAEKGLTLIADAGFRAFDFINSFNHRPSFTPAWADKPLLKSHEKVKPPLGWPRETDSLCPVCVREARQAIVDGKQDDKILLNEKVGEIKATILERDGKIMLVKECPNQIVTKVKLLTQEMTEANKVMPRGTTKSETQSSTNLKVMPSRRVKESMLSWRFKRRR